MSSVNIETLLVDEIEHEFGKLYETECGSEKHKVAVDGVTKLVDRVIELERLDIDRAERAAAREGEQLLKLQQTEEDKKDRLVKNLISVGGIVLPLIVTIWGTKVSLKFEETGTITTQMGRGFIQRLFSKK